MVAQFEKEAEEDEEVYEQMGCWCKSNEKGTEQRLNCKSSRIQSHHPVIAQLETKWIVEDEEAYEQMRYWCETNDEDTDTSKGCDSSRIQSHHPYEGYGCALRQRS